MSNFQLAIKRELNYREVKADIIYVNFNKFNYFLLEGGRNGGKTQKIARALLQLASEQKLRIFCGREIQATITDSVYTVLKNIIIELGLTNDFHILNTSITHKETGSEFRFKGFREQGLHNIKGLEDIDILWIDEAQAITKSTLDVVIPTVRKEGSKVIFSMNRFQEDDPIYEDYNHTNERKDVLHLHVNYLDNKYLSQKMINEADACKKKNYDDYLHIWMGEPQKESSDNCAISLKSLRKCVDREVIGNGRDIVGIDVARYGDDRTTMYKRRGYNVYDYRVYTKDDIQIDENNSSGLIKLADYAEQFVEFKKDAIFNIDDTGVGGGLTDILISRGYTVFGINNNGNPKEKEINKRKNKGKTQNNPDYIYDNYYDTITEMHFEFSENIDKYSIPDNPMLLKELSSRRYYYTKDQRKAMESKKDFKKRYKKSPDDGDGFLLCVYEPPPKPKITFTRF